MVRRHLRFLLLLSLLPLAAVLCHADEVDELLARVDEAVADESYTRAISLLEDGKKRYPEDARFSVRAGNLYRTVSFTGWHWPNISRPGNWNPDPGNFFRILRPYTATWETMRRR